MTHQNHVPKIQQIYEREINDNLNINQRNSHALLGMSVKCSQIEK